MLLVCVARECKAGLRVAEFGAREGVRKPACKLVGTSSLQRQLEAASVTVQRVAKRKLCKRYPVALNSRLSKAEEYVGVLAIISFSEHSGAIAEAPFDTDVVMCRTFSAQTAIAEPAKHLLKIRKLVISSGGGANFPVLIHRPSQRCAWRNKCLAGNFTVFDPRASSQRKSQAIVSPGVLPVEASLRTASLEAAEIAQCTEKE